MPTIKQISLATKDEWPQLDDIYEFTQDITTPGGVHKKGDWIRLIKHNVLSPYGFVSKFGNWLCEHQDGTQSVWSSIERLIISGILTKVE